MQKLILSFITFLLVLAAFTPYFTTDFLDLRQKGEERIQKENNRIAEEKIYLTGKFDPAQREDFILVSPKYTLVPNKIYLRKETYGAYLQMRNAASKDSIDLKIASATRNFDYQKDLWEKKWTGITIVDGKDLSKSMTDEQERFEKILEYSAVPGTSRHHWGTDIDINDASLQYFDSQKGKKEYEWLTKNAYQFGFCQTYNLKGSTRPTGYNEEKWHWSYLPLSRIFMQEYKNLIKNEDMKGFLGEEYTQSLDLLNNYVLSINSDCI